MSEQSATIVKLFFVRAIQLGLEYQLNLPGAYEYRSRDIAFVISSKKRERNQTQLDKHN